MCQLSNTDAMIIRECNECKASLSNTKRKIKALEGADGHRRVTLTT